MTGDAVNGARGANGLEWLVKWVTRRDWKQTFDWHFKPQRVDDVTQTAKQNANAPKKGYETL